MKIKYILIGLLFASCSKEKDIQPSNFSVERRSPIRPTTTRILTDIDGNNYRTVRIGNQVWMAEDLRVKHYSNGDPITYIPGDTTWINTVEGGYCFYISDTTGITDSSRVIYNGFVIADLRGIAPQGWHVPNEEDWGKLILYYDPTADTAAGDGLQSFIAQTFISENTPFNGVWNGIRNYEIGQIAAVRGYAYWWSHSPNDDLFPDGLRVHANRPNDHGRVPAPKRWGCGLRLVKDN